MRLSELVELARGTDPEILVYEEDGDRWMVSEAGSAMMAKGRITLAPDHSSVRAVSKDGETPDEWIAISG